MQIDKQLISRLEELARLDLSEQERESLMHDLNAILKMVDKLNELDTTGVKPLTHVNESVNNWREDKVGEHLDTNTALQNAPQHEGWFFKVPKVKE